MPKVWQGNRPGFRSFYEQDGGTYTPPSCYVITNSDEPVITLAGDYVIVDCLNLVNAGGQTLQNAGGTTLIRG